MHPVNTQLCHSGLVRLTPVFKDPSNRTINFLPSFLPPTWPLKPSISMGSGPHKLTENMESLYAAKCTKESGSHHLSLIAASLPNLSICLALVSQPALILKVCLALGLCLDFLNFWSQNIDCYFWVTQDWGLHEAFALSESSEWCTQTSPGPQGNVTWSEGKDPTTSQEASCTCVVTRIHPVVFCRESLWWRVICPLVGGLLHVSALSHLDQTPRLASI